MMKSRVIFMVLLLMGAAALFADSGAGLISDIGLYSRSSRPTDSPPSHLVIVVDITKTAYYKVTDPGNEEIITGGKFLRGGNFIVLPAEDLFDESSSHVYILALKTGGTIVEKELRIAVRLRTRQKEEKAAGHDAQAVYDEKVHRVNVTGKLKDGPLAGSFGSPSHIDGSYPYMSGGIPILPLAVLLAEKIFRKKAKAVPKPIPRFQEIVVTFRKRDERGSERRIDAAIKLETSDR